MKGKHVNFLHIPGQGLGVLLLRICIKMGIRTFYGNRTIRDKNSTLSSKMLINAKHWPETLYQCYCVSFLQSSLCATQFRKCGNRSAGWSALAVSPRYIAPTRSQHSRLASSHRTMNPLQAALSALPVAGPTPGQAAQIVLLRKGQCARFSHADSA